MVSRDELIKVFTEISDFEEMKAFIGEILTPQQKTGKEVEKIFECTGKY